MEKNILVIETDALIRAEIQQTAHEYSLDVVEAQSLADGISRAANQKIKMVIIGEYLLDGPLRAVISRIRAVLPQSAIIILEHSDEGIQAAEGMGVPYITPPFAGSVFQSRLSSQFMLVRR
ncbi:MAG: hypothetical protein H7175_20955 [Burkholderiales bacterium]|nr:hypothetical protein [Anaerolineae bacterium]